MEADELVLDDVVDDALGEELDEVAVVDVLVLEVVEEVEVLVAEGAKVAVRAPAPLATKVVEAEDWFAKAMLPGLESHPEKT
jgi:hypothetical protein